MLSITSTESNRIFCCFVAQLEPHYGFWCITRLVPGADHTMLARYFIKRFVTILDVIVGLISPFGTFLWHFAVIHGIFLAFCS